jgi:hypothetical protein
MLVKIAIFRGKKVLKNNFFNKFHGIFRGKSLSVEKNIRKIGPRDMAVFLALSNWFCYGSEILKFAVCNFRDS